jgi:hypothetical protein
LAQAALDAFNLEVEVAVNTAMLGGEWENWELNRDRQDWTSE